jgi:hypothetical protein
VKHVLGLRLPGVRGVAVVTVATIAVALAAVPAVQAASTSTWKVNKVYPVGAGGSGISSVSAVSRSDVWVAGGICTTETTHGCTKNSALVGRWNGRAWQAMPAPSGAVSGIAATSPANAWALEVPSTTASRARLLAQHWTGRSWSKAIVLGTGSGIRPAAEVAPSASSVWAFGSDFSTASRSFVAHYNGKSWSMRSFPYVIDEASAVTATDIWVIGGVASAARNGIWARVEHWTGGAWRSVALPHITVPSGDGLYGIGIAALSAGNVWAEFGVGGTDPQTWTIKLAHLTGTTWSVATVPASLGVFGNTFPGQLIASARGGVWMGLINKQASSGPLLPVVFVQRVGNGWKVVPPGTSQYLAIDAMAAVPGTAAAVAVGELNPRSTGSRGIVLGHGI